MYGKITTWSLKWVGVNLRKLVPEAISVGNVIDEEDPEAIFNYLWVECELKRNFTVFTEIGSTVLMNMCSYYIGFEGSEYESL